MSTIGDALDRSMGGPDHYVSHHCVESHHHVCLGYYGGRTCECPCHATKRMISCSWCHELNPVGQKKCDNCDHRADLPRSLCDCRRCRNRIR